MKPIVEKMLTIIDNIKACLNKPENEKYIKSAGLSFAAFLWVYILTGNPMLSLIYAIGGFVISIARDVLREHKKLLFLVAFWGVSAVAFSATYIFYTPTKAWFSIGTWLVVYWMFVRAKKMTEWVTGSLIPLVIVLIAEIMQNNIKTAIKVLFADDSILRIGFVLSAILVAVVISLAVQIFNSKRIGYYVSVGFFGLLCFINYFVYVITGNPFTISDLSIATTAAGVLGTQHLYFTDWLGAFLSLLLWAAIYAVITVVYKKETKKEKYINRVVPIGVLCGLLVIAFSASSWLSSTLLLFNGHLKYGFIGNFYITIDSSLNIPEDAKDYVIEDKNEEGDFSPNVIVIMNEAFSDLNATFGVQMTEDPLSYFHSLQEKYPHGVTYSSVKGNNTCSSEWELLSGTPTALTAKGALIYQQNSKPMQSLVSLFNSRGYKTVGFHPYYRNGYNRNSMYQNLGFDQTVFLEDLNENLSTVRGYVTDEENYKKLIELYEQNEAEGSAPFFCFNITMQNHGSYTNKQMDDVKVTGDKTYADVNTYLSVLKHSDSALKTLISYFESVDEETIILFFGDHQPMIDNVFYDDLYGKSYNDLTIEERKDVFEIPYLIWANYDLDESAAPDETSNCYLSSILFDVGNIPKSTWLNMVSEYRKEYPVISSVFIKDADGDIKAVNTMLNAENGGGTETLLLYQKYSYGVLYGVE